MESNPVQTVQSGQSSPGDPIQSKRSSPAGSLFRSSNPAASRSRSSSSNPVGEKRKKRNEKWWVVGGFKYLLGSPDYKFFRKGQENSAGHLRQEKFRNCTSNWLAKLTNSTVSWHYACSDQPQDSLAYCHENATNQMRTWRKLGVFF